MPLSRVIEKRCVRDVAYRVIAGCLHPDHATFARFRARHEKALGGLFSQVLRLLAAEGCGALGIGRTPGRAESVSLQAVPLTDDGTVARNKTSSRRPAASVKRPAAAA